MCHAELIEPMPITDIYADGIGSVEVLGVCVRVTLYTRQGADRVVVCKIVRPIDGFDLTPFYAMLAERKHAILSH